MNFTQALYKLGLHPKQWIDLILLYLELKIYIKFLEYYNDPWGYDGN